MKGKCMHRSLGPTVWGDVDGMVAKTWPYAGSTVLDQCKEERVRCLKPL